MRLQVIFSLLSAHFANPSLWLDPLAGLARLHEQWSLSSSEKSLFDNDNASYHNKSIVIVGAGSAGLAMLKALTELPEETRQSLEFVLLEEREDVGGIWLPNNHVSYPPELPETPLYPRLRTNTPVPTMTYPNFTFPPGTPLYPSHTHVLAYLRRYAAHFDLYSHIAFNHRVMEAEWIGTPYAGQWNLTILNPAGVNETRIVDHIVVASGNNHIPSVPSWQGQDVWLERDSDREILHSVYYRYPNRYANRRVLVVGGGASGRDASEQISESAQKVYLSLRSPSSLDLSPNVELKPGISHFTNNTIVFDDKSEVEVDSVILATGYQMRKPFLEAGKTMAIDLKHHLSPMEDINSSESVPLTTNLKYIFPLYRHIFSLCPSYPPTALSFIGLPSGIANCPSDYAQSLFVVNLILNPDTLPSRDDMLADLAAQEQIIRDNGLDPYAIGHRLLNGTSSDYQDELIDLLRENGVIPSWTPNFVEQWRRDAGAYSYLRRGWIHIEELGQADQWLQGVETEEQWADLMRRVNSWQEDWEKENNVPFVHEHHYGYPEFGGEFYLDEDYW